MRHFAAHLGFVAFLSAGCQTFDPPPSASIEGLDNGVMTTAPDAPFVVRFSEPIRQDSLRLKLVKNIHDAEGNLLDEQDPSDPDAFQESIAIAADGSDLEDLDKSFGGKFDLGERTLGIEPKIPFVISQPYLAIVEPGLEDRDGHETVPRQRIPFSFKMESGCPTAMPSGYYYFLMNVDYLSQQIQVFTYLEGDSSTGDWRAIFTKGMRREELNSRPGCPSCSGDAPVCALVPAPKCVKPSEKQLTLEQYVDRLPEPNPPNGYTFVADGFACDQPNGNTSFGTLPFLIALTIGTGNIAVRAENTVVTGIFQPDESGRWRGTGAVSAERVKLNGIGKDGTGGNWQAMSLTDAEVKAVQSFGFPIPTNLGK